MRDVILFTHIRTTYHTSQNNNKWTQKKKTHGVNSIHWIHEIGTLLKQKDAAEKRELSINSKILYRDCLYWIGHIYNTHTHTHKIHFKFDIFRQFSLIKIYWIVKVALKLYIWGCTLSWELKKGKSKARWNSIHSWWFIWNNIYSIVYKYRCILWLSIWQMWPNGILKPE